MKSLTEEAVRQYHEQGYYAPVRALGTAEAGELRRELEAFEASAGQMQGVVRHKPHLLFTWLNDLISHPCILDAVEDIVGPDILCWGSSFFIKEARNPGYVSWHQDSTYWGLDPADVVTAWVAFSDSTAANGAMQVIPRTHTLDQVPHRDTFAADNLLSRGQEILVEVDEHQAVVLELAAGEMSLHHVRLIHGSDPNPSEQRRIGFASATSRPMCARSPARMTARRWCAVWAPITTWRKSAGPTPTCRRRLSPITPRSPALTRGF